MADADRLTLSLSSGGDVVINGLGDAAEIEKTRAGIEAEFGVRALYHGANMLKGDEIMRDFEEKLPAVVTKCDAPNTLALSFDDGPSIYTEKLLDVLKAYGARATFFLSGITNGRESLDSPKWKPVLQRMFSERHQIASHGWSHRNLNNISHSERVTEITKNERAIANAIGMVPTFFRAPYIACNTESGCRKTVRDLGYHLVE